MRVCRSAWGDGARPFSASFAWMKASIGFALSPDAPSTTGASFLSADGWMRWGTAGRFNGLSDHQSILSPSLVPVFVFAPAMAAGRRSPHVNSAAARQITAQGKYGPNILNVARESLNGISVENQFCHL